MDLQQVSNISSRFLAQLDEASDLPLVVRQELIDELEERIANEHKAAQHYWGLSLACAKKVYFRWHSQHPETDLRVWIQNFLASRGLEKSIEELAKLHKYLDRVFESCPTKENELAVASAMAIYATGRDATTGRVRPPFVNSGSTDDEVIPEFRDASYYASVAYSAGGPSDPNSDLERRRQFWTWYLTEAVPAAYSAPI